MGVEAHEMLNLFHRDDAPLVLGGPEQRLLLKPICRPNETGLLASLTRFWRAGTQSMRDGAAAQARSNRREAPFREVTTLKVPRTLARREI